MKKKKIQFHRSRPTATTKPNPALILDHNHLLKGTETERISQEAAGVIGNMTNSEAIKEERVIEVVIEEDVKAAGMKIGVTQGEATETEMTDIVVDIKTPEMHHMNEAETTPNPLTVIAAATEIVMMVTEKRETEDAMTVVTEDANLETTTETDAVIEIEATVVNEAKDEIVVENATVMTVETETPEEATSIDPAKETKIEIKTVIAAGEKAVEMTKNKRRKNKLYQRKC